MPEERQTFILTEYIPLRLPAQAIASGDGEDLWRRYGKALSVEFPSPKTDDKWQITSQGWVGYVPVSAKVGLSLQPKVPLPNLFRMIEVAYGLDVLHFSADLFQCATLVEFYERLALLLAERIWLRLRRGLYQTYQSRTADLPYVRGRLYPELSAHDARPHRVHCEYEEQTVDVEENRILAWTLWQILCSRLCSKPIHRIIHHVYRALLGTVMLQPYTRLDCIDRPYNRLNEDYRPLHALCCLFLDQSGPSYAPGEQAMLAFLINTATLYERFVAAWMVAHVPQAYSVRVQERVQFGREPGHTFAIDMVIYHRETGRPQVVVDTKYKVPVTSPASSDLAQAVAYATAKGCKDALLVYPVELACPFDEQIGDVRVRSVAFNLDDNLTLAGERLLQTWLSANHEQ